MDMAVPPPEDQASGYPTVLVVDDTALNLSILGELLGSRYRVRTASSGIRALLLARAHPLPDVILLDVMMPGMDGYQVITQLKADPLTADIPVIFITAMSGIEEEQLGFELGAVDYITKPFIPSIVRARVATHVDLKQAKDRIGRINVWLEQEVRRRTNENTLIQDLAIRALACLGETRDTETGKHIIRTQGYIELLVNRLAEHPRFIQALEGNRSSLIVKAAPLHDIGKVGVPDAILLKPGKLTAEEFEIMKRHPVIGAKAIDKAMTQALASTHGYEVEQARKAFLFLEIAKEISLAHHERWDGSGYPAGLAGDQIPASARLMALADVFDALVSARVYKPTIPFEEASRIINAARGTQFDPAVVDAFNDLRDSFLCIASQFADTPDGKPEHDQHKAIIQVSECNPG
jgi:putative two-component system response regulator